MTCKDCIHYCVCKDTVADENWSDEAPAELRVMYSPEGCENFTEILHHPETCEHCHPPFKRFGKYYIKTGYSNDPTLYVLRRSECIGGVMIEYCPMCGRKLDQPIED